MPTIPTFYRLHAMSGDIAASQRASTWTTTTLVLVAALDKNHSLPHFVSPTYTHIQTYRHILYEYCGSLPQTEKISSIQ